MTQQTSVVLDIWGHPLGWKCSYKRRCSSKRWGIGEPHSNCIFEGFCAYQFYVANGKVDLDKPKEVSV
jgi:hypothetical protein